eukprot:UN10713
MCLSSVLVLLMELQFYNHHIESRLHQHLRAQVPSLLLFRFRGCRNVRHFPFFQCSHRKN